MLIYFFINYIMKRNLDETEKVILKAFKECPEFMVHTPGEKIMFSSEDQAVTLQGNSNKMFRINTKNILG